MPDPDFSKRDALKDENLEITLDDEAAARDKSRALKEAGVEANVTMDRDEDRRAALRGDMRDELEATVMGPGNVGPWTKSMNKGIVKWVAICATAGAGVLFLVGLAVWPSATGLASMAAIGATAGATFGFVIGGFLGPAKTDEGDPDALSRHVMGVHAESPEELEKAERIVGEEGAVRVDRVNHTGRPASRPYKDTRPLRGDTPT